VAISLALGLQVEQHDDGTESGMHDLDIHAPTGIEAVEVTSATDSRSIKQWNALDHGQIWIEDTLAGGWCIEFYPETRIKDLQPKVVRLLADLEHMNVNLVDTSEQPLDEPALLARSLGIAYAWRGPTDIPGSVYPILYQERRHSSPGPDQSIGQWVSDFLSSPPRSDVLDKLSRSGTAYCHAVVIVPALSDAPANVEATLLNSEEPKDLPPPSLPTPVTNVWIASLWAAGAGLRWDPEEGWQRFATDIPVPQSA